MTGRYRKPPLDPRPSFIERGSTVRVRKRALQKPRKSGFLRKRSVGRPVSGWRMSGCGAVGGGGDLRAGTRGGRRCRAGVVGAVGGAGRAAGGAGGAGRGARAAAEARLG